MISESFDISETDLVSTRDRIKNTYQVKKKLFWLILSVLLGIFVVLLVLTIFYGVRQKHSKSHLPAPSEHLAVNSTSQLTTLTTTLASPVERVPTKLKQENYHVTISPNLTAETFTGEICSRAGQVTSPPSL